MISLLLAIATPTAMHVPAAFQTLPNVARMSDTRICETMRGFAAQVSNGQQAEGSTRLDRITVVCAMREVSFGQAIATVEDAEGAATELDQAVCQNPALRQLADRGWTLSSSMTTSDGASAFRDIDCGGGSGAVSAVR